MKQVKLGMFVGMMMLCGCDESTRTVETKTALGYGVVIVEGCEYFKISNCYGDSYTHKGNCTNPIHVYARKEDNVDVEVKKNRADRRKKKEIQ